ncbi:ribonuclease HII [Cyanobium sp. LEGE 06113]|uniref:ribonuclease HII n=1 Tax=Cyanobium sp. LEGE 06113 TaxID=1297573 RepID=UPI001882473E|nr:ribonuclease HII [Cyanobium sp. LEGE 06113]MBE9155222.1 ribonuclease HII [Cyanobium sp. LEGE 06113]
MAEDPWLGWPPGRCAGVDEVGRGCLFGPVFAAAVVLDSTAAVTLLTQGLTDSKKLSPRRRAILVPQIESLALAWGLGQASAASIDQHGIRDATEAAMLQALQRLPAVPGLVLVDGVLPLRGWPGEQVCLVRGDSRQPAIAAASVLAKQARDGLIRQLAASYPGYGLERHVGYGTPQHRAALLQLGPTPLHRTSFLRKLWPGQAAGPQGSR